MSAEISGESSRSSSSFLRDPVLREQGKFGGPAPVTVTYELAIDGVARLQLGVDAAAMLPAGVVETGLRFRGAGSGMSEPRMRTAVAIRGGGGPSQRRLHERVDRPACAGRFRAIRLFKRENCRRSWRVFGLRLDGLAPDDPDRAWRRVVLGPSSSAELPCLGVKVTDVVEGEEGRGGEEPRRPGSAPPYLRSPRAAPRWKPRAQTGGCSHSAAKIPARAEIARAAELPGAGGFPSGASGDQSGRRPA